MTNPDRAGVDRLLVVAQRELTTVVRTRTFALLTALFVGLVTVLAWLGSATRGYVLVALALLTPLELLVPLLGFAFGYRAILGDARRGELEMIRSYPLSRAEFVAGVYLGRAAALLPGVLLALVFAGVLAAFGGGPTSAVLAAHGTLDSALLYVRFVVLTALYAAVALALAVAVSAVVRTTRQALAAVAVVFLTVAVGLDLGLVAVLAGSDPSVPGFDVLLAASPTSAYRGLVLESVVHVVSPRRLGPAINPVAAVLGLLAWGVAGLGTAVVAVWGE